jgi:hypothetical protein
VAFKGINIGPEDLDDDVIIKGCSMSRPRLLLDDFLTFAWLLNIDIILVIFESFVPLVVDVLAVFPPPSALRRIDSNIISLRLYPNRPIFFLWQCKRLKPDAETPTIRIMIKISSTGDAYSDMEIHEHELIGSNW